MKFVLVLDRDKAIFELSKMYAGKCVSDLKKETNEADDTIFDSREKEMDNTLPKGRQGSLLIPIFHSFALLDEVVYAGPRYFDKEVTNDHIIAVKRKIAVYSFAAECLSA